MTPLSQMLGEAPGMVAVREQIARLVQRWREGPQRLPSILIQGETGTGKGLIAHVLHRTGPRASAPFVDVDCAAIPETLLEAELFGVERGAFTDARQARPGLFQAAHGGMLFLDEVALLPLPLQAKLLKALEERVVRRLGGTRREPVDVWVVAASNEDLRAAAGAGGFREDLYHRLAVVTVRLPPLRERGEDILRLAEHFLARACVDYDLPPKVLTDGARGALLRYPWPGNVRELANVMERVALLAEAAAVTAPMLDLPERPAAPAAGADHQPRRPALHAALAGVERAHLEEAMGAAEGNLSRAAARLGIPRNTLRYRLEKHGLTAAGAPPQRRARARPKEAAGGGPVVPGGAAGGLRWEPRRVTFLRAHLGGRPGAGGLDAGRAMEVVLEKVRSFGGSVEELAPGGVLAAFGALPLEDAPRHAGYAAAAIQKAAVRAGSEEATRPAVRLALHTEQLPVGRAPGGTAVLDADARRAAEEVLAALLARAEMDTVVVSAPAAAFLRRRFELVPLGAVAGTAGPAYRLAGQAEPDRMLTPFVGREPELRLLAERFERARGGRARWSRWWGRPASASPASCASFAGTWATRRPGAKATPSSSAGPWRSRRSSTCSGAASASTRATPRRPSSGSSNGASPAWGRTCGPRSRSSATCSPWTPATPPCWRWTPSTVAGRSSRPCGASSCGPPSSAPSSSSSRTRTGWIRRPRSTWRSWRRAWRRGGCS